MRVMKQRTAIINRGRNWTQRGLASLHGRLVMAGLLVGLVYAPFWILDIVRGTLNGAASLLMVSAFALGLYQLWIQRHALAQVRAASEDRFLGHWIIAVGIGAAPVGAFEEWSQKLIWLMILGGIAISTWGLGFFARYSAPTFLIAVGLFPQPTVVGKAVWDAFTPPEMLERFMAWCGALGLNAIGQAAKAELTYISLANSTVKVDWGCSGYDLACIAAVASLLMAMYFEQSFGKTILLVLAGIVLAMVANVPRIMLMTMAEAYWGKESFHFWHGFWGGQIFLTVLFTVHYYVVMALINRSTKGSKV
jgi:exosortase/archaeosortase family protein